MTVEPKKLKDFYRFDFVTDPDDPEVQSDLSKLIDIIELNSKIIMTETLFSRGLIRYTIDIETKYIPDSAIINNINYLTEVIGYVPVTISYDLTSFKRYADFGSIITGLSTIIKVITTKLLHIEVKNVETIQLDNNIVLFSPMSEENIAIYENSMSLREYYEALDIKFIGGYQLLSDDPIVNYVVDTFYKDGDYVSDDLHIRYLYKTAIIPVGKTLDSIDFFSEARDKIQQRVREKKQKGYFTYDISLQNISDITIIPDVSQLWDWEYIYDKDMVTVVLKQRIDQNLGTIPSFWLQHGLEKIREGQFPETTLYGQWQFNYLVDEDISQYKAIVYYGAVMAYYHLGLDDPYIQGFTQAVKVNPDLSITISVPTYKHLKEYKAYLNETLVGYINDDSPLNILVEPCKDLEECIVKKYYVQLCDPKAHTLILPVDGINVLVTRTPLLDQNNYIFDFNDGELNETYNSLDDVKAELMKNLKEYYKTCSGYKEPVTLDNIGDMDITQLLNLIKIDERSNQPSFCYDRNTILSLDPPVNPMSRRPININILMKAMMWEWGLRGLFDIGPLHGLYQDFRIKTYVQPNLGSIIIDEEIIDPILQQSLGKVYNVDVKFPDNSTYPMFQIATENLDELKNTTDKLWNKGFFLNYWVGAVQKYSDGMESFAPNIDNPLLLSASDNKNAGTRAMEFLKESLLTLESSEGK